MNNMPVHYIQMEVYASLEYSKSHCLSLVIPLINSCVVKFVDRGQFISSTFFHI